MKRKLNASQLAAATAAAAAAAAAVAVATVWCLLLSLSTNTFQFFLCFNCVNRCLIIFSNFGYSISCPYIFEI